MVMLRLSNLGGPSGTYSSVVHPTEFRERTGGPHHSVKDHGYVMNHASYIGLFSDGPVAIPASFMTHARPLIPHGCAGMVFAPRIQSAIKPIGSLSFSLGVVGNRVLAVLGLQVNEPGKRQTTAA